MRRRRSVRSGRKPRLWSFDNIQKFLCEPLFTTNRIKKTRTNYCLEIEMKNRIVSLWDMIKLSDNEELSESYIRYICGIDAERQYKHQEIVDIQCLLNVIQISAENCAGFLYGYVVPQLNKEFDLLKITDKACVNIELKSGDVSVEKIKRQLVQNAHYLKLLNKSTLQLFLFVFSLFLNIIFN